MNHKNIKQASIWNVYLTCSCLYSVPSVLVTSAVFLVVTRAAGDHTEVPLIACVSYMCLWRHVPADPGGICDWQVKLMRHFMRNINLLVFETDNGILPAILHHSSADVQFKAACLISHGLARISYKPGHSAHMWLWVFFHSSITVSVRGISVHCIREVSVIRWWYSYPDIRQTTEIPFM